jgi:predicted TIM-barrel fold metal-dependent hydrolase
MTNTQNESVIARPLSAPKKPLPAGAWDCHTHVFGPFEKYPILEDRLYDPPLATGEDFISMLNTVGFDHGVIVHAGANGWDNRATSDAVQKNWPRLRAVGVLPADTPLKELEAFHASGMRGMRVTDLTGFPMSGPGVLDAADIPTLMPKFEELGWHIDLWGTPDVTINLPNVLKGRNVPVILDHMAFPKLKDGIKDPVFDTLLSVIADNNFYVKMTINRLSNNFPDFEDMRAMYEAIATRLPNQIVFGSDWPFISQGELMPDTGKMVDVFDAFVPDDDIRQKAFVDNPTRFYGA